MMRLSLIKQQINRQLIILNFAYVNYIYNACQIIFMSNMKAQFSQAKKKSLFEIDNAQTFVLCGLQIAYPFQDKRYTIQKL